jgi:DNA (cytosine-5)-methyltransferase 1
VIVIRRKPALTAIGCHIYAGGFTLGVRDRFKVLAHLEEGSFGVETVRANMPGLPVSVGAETWVPFCAKLPRPDLLYGNPPCASWSIAGVKVKDKEERNEKRWSHDARTDCTVRLFGLLSTLRPKVFIWESVMAAMRNGREFIDARVAQVNALGYHAHLVTFNGLDLGLPQTRKRFFFVATKVALSMPAPSWPAHHRTVRDALATLPGNASKEGAKISDNYLRILKSMKPGEKSLHKAFMSSLGDREPELNKHGGVKGRPGFLNQRLVWDEPAPTITGGPQFFHPAEPRSLTVVEQQIMCGYPADYKFVGSTGDKYAQISKAVLPPAARWISGIVADGIESNQTIEDPSMEENPYV